MGSVFLYFFFKSFQSLGLVISLRVTVRVRF